MSHKNYPCPPFVFRRDVIDTTDDDHFYGEPA
jgi:hypothetical protein